MEWLWFFVDIAVSCVVKRLARASCMAMEFGVLHDGSMHGHDNEDYVECVE